MIKLGVLVCSLTCFVESIAQFFYASASKENIMNLKKEDASTIANAAAQKHFRQIQHTC